ncbi:MULTISPECIES: LysM peptidoglycan-binding domain-containing protein [Acidiphilium]|uniref:LysM domain-containing protein n=1 Tax=Acidiphilium rubrum TaxID=526 RepID=A0A8G2FLM4_ACIRU|nr:MULTISPECIES: hypothetical protein [Acidiphilium]SIR29280.1 hypothetical protein SAMN05421828_12321 [Acidiphilium rubrum]
MFETYRVKSGDCLWNISKHRFGYGHLWPSIYSFNNWAAARRIQNAKSIVDPNLIYPKQLVLIPDLDMQLLRPLVRSPRLTSVIDAADQAARGHTNRIDPRLIAPSTIARDQRRNPAAYLHFKPFWAFEYDLDNLKTIEFHVGALQAEVKWSGTILMQPVHDEALVTLSNHGAVISQEFKADTVLGELSTGIDMTYQPTTKKLTFSCNLTRAGHGVVPSIAFEGDDEGPKFLLKWQPFSGNFQGYSFIATCQAEVTIKAGSGGGKTGESGSTSSGPSTGTNPSARSIPGPPQKTLLARQNPSARSIPGPSNRLVMKDKINKPSSGVARPNGLAPLIGILGVIGLGLATTGQFIERNPELGFFLAAG